MHLFVISPFCVCVLELIHALMCRLEHVLMWAKQLRSLIAGYRQTWLKSQKNTSSKLCTSSACGSIPCACTFQCRPVSQYSCCPCDLLSYGDGCTELYRMATLAQKILEKYPDKLPEKYQCHDTRRATKLNLEHQSRGYNAARDKFLAKRMVMLF